MASFLNSNFQIRKQSNGYHARHWGDNKEGEFQVFNIEARFVHDIELDLFEILLGNIFLLLL